MAKKQIDQLVEAAEVLRKTVDALDFREPVTHVYNPLRYAWPMHEAYLSRFGEGNKRVLMLGLNPGPWGMAQTGVPFGEVTAVRDWMKLDEPIGKPWIEHPKRPVEGLACTRSEVSGARLWGLFSERFGTAEAFFRGHFITNYCPLCFMEESGRNYTPDKLPKAERASLEAACDLHLSRVIETTRPTWVIGIGKFAEKVAGRVVKAMAGSSQPTVGTILHPSPASPAANRGWAEQATRQLIELGVWS